MANTPAETGTPSAFDGLPEGAGWHRCCLQVNSFEYQQHRGAPLGQTVEEDYNNALVDALVQAGVSVIAITDHWCVDSGETLRYAAQASGITAFPGFEATTKDGVHLLVLFDPAAHVANINRNIGECGIPADCHDSRPGTLDFLELLERAEAWGAVVVAPHVTTGGGLLDKLSGQSAVRAWTDSRLHAVAVSGAALSQGHKAILDNKDSAYNRNNHLAVIGAADVNGPADVAKTGSSSWIKLSSLTTSGLDLAFRTPETRVSRTDPSANVHSRIIGMTWEGGFLDGMKIRFNDSLNVLIGGRGSGKSTVIESLRYALALKPLTPSSAEDHAGMIKQVLGAGTKVLVAIQVRIPSDAVFTIERLVGSAPVVRDSTGALLQSAPLDLLRGVEIYGQRELAELARNRQQLTSLLAQYLPNGTEDEQIAATNNKHWSGLGGQYWPPKRRSKP